MSPPVGYSPRILIPHEPHLGAPCGCQGQDRMNLSGIIVMILVLAGIWGGFAYLVYLNVKQGQGPPTSED